MSQNHITSDADLLQFTQGEHLRHRDLSAVHAVASQVLSMSVNAEVEISQAILVAGEESPQGREVSVPVALDVNGAPVGITYHAPILGVVEDLEVFAPMCQDGVRLNGAILSMDLVRRWAQEQANS